MELRTNLSVHIAYTYLYVYRDVPSKRCFSFTWYPPGCARVGQTGQVARGVLAMLAGRGVAAPPAALGADSVAALLSVELHVMAAWWSWKSQWSTWSWLHHTPLPTAWAKTSPVPANVSLTPWTATVFLHLTHLLRVIFFCPLQMNFQVQWKFCIFSPEFSHFM